MENETEKAYKAIFKLLKKHRDLIVLDIDRLEIKSKFHLFGIKLKEEYGFDIDPKSINNLQWQKLNDNISIGWYGDKYGRKIGWSDDGTQPTDELLLDICFPTGAYIFGGDYPKEFFEKFFLELKSYKPKYVDTTNKSLYFSMDNAAKVYNVYDSLFKKYDEMNSADIKQRQIEKMKEDLAKLESDTK